MSTTSGTRLGPDDWLNAGVAVLGAQGHKGLGAEPLARRLGTTKGSFYWHFEDVPTFNRALLSLWQAEADQALDQNTTRSMTDAARLRKIAQEIVTNPVNSANAVLRAEPAIRAWARSDPDASVAVLEVDEKRLARFRQHLDACGIGNPEMARILYASAIGMTVMEDRNSGQNAESIGSLVDLMLALR